MAQVTENYVSLVKKKRTLTEFRMLVLREFTLGRISRNGAVCRNDVDWRGTYSEKQLGLTSVLHYTKTNSVA
jgi:hypothetical protein